MPAPQQAPIQDQTLQQLSQAATHNANAGIPHMPANTVQFDPSKLVDIQLPEKIAWWPIAPGWWILFVLFIAIILVSWYFIKRKPAIKAATAKQFKTQAMKELQRIRKKYEAQAHDIEVSHSIVKELSIFLRRYALSLYSREKVASLTDQQWLLLLDKTYNSQTKDDAKKYPLFSEKFAQLLIEVPYQANTQFIDQLLLNELFDSSEILINKTARLFAQKHSLQKESHRDISYQGKNNV
jgi:hypothetical protein